MGLSDNTGGAAGELINKIGPLRFLQTNEPYKGSKYRVILGEPTRYFAPDGQELEPVYPIRPREVSQGPNVYQARENLEGLTVLELNGIAAAEKITGYSKMNKSQLIAAITTTQVSKGEL